MAEPATSALRLSAAPALPISVTQLRDGSSLAVLPPRTLVRLQLARRRAVEAAGVRIRGTPLPTVPGAAAGDDPAALWLAPDGWLLISDTLAPAELAREARHALDGRTGAAVDVSDALVTLELSGPGMRALLARSTGLELTEEALAPGRCTRTRFAQLAVILRPRASDRVEILVDRGPAHWLCEWLADASTLL